MDGNSFDADDHDKEDDFDDVDHDMVRMIMINDNIDVDDHDKEDDFDDVEALTYAPVVPFPLSATLTWNLKRVILKCM